MIGDQHENTSFYNTRFEKHNLDDDSLDSFDFLESSYSYKKLQKLDSIASQPPIRNAQELDSEPTETTVETKNTIIVRFHTSLN